MPELPLVGDEFAGYRLRSVIGRGGMSTVYQAENPRLGNLIALKVLAPELATDDMFRARFLEESRIAAGMNHPHVIPIHDTGSSDGLLYIAMRYVSGTDLGKMIKKRGRLQPQTAVLLLSQAARALDAAHRRGLVHRDVKPANLLIERGNDEPDPDHLYLADFGITKMASGRTGLTLTGAVMGTPDYMAPEQFRGLSVVGMADQYSLGCVLYECLTGRVPFDKDLNDDIRAAHIEEYPTRPTLLRPELPPAIDDMFVRVLAKQPGDRFENCREFMAAARDALDLIDPGRFDQGPGLRDQTARVRWPGPPPMEELPYASALPVPGAPPQEWAEPYLPQDPGPGRGSLLLLAVACVIALALGVTIGAWTGLRQSPGAGASTGGPGAAAALGTPALSATSTKTLRQALAAVNVTHWTTGYLPPATCTFISTGYARCSHPYPGITEAVFQNYSSPRALYQAYEAAIKLANNGHFAVNVQDCGESAPPGNGGEISWNHLGLHTPAFSIAQLETGKLSASSQAAGRVFCNYNSGTNTEDVIWTQTDGNMLGEATGSPHLQVWYWWLHVHHNIAFNGQPMGAEDTPMPPAMPTG